LLAAGGSVLAATNLYMPEMKYGNAETAVRYSRIHNYG
jgi:uncharacterized Fe-S radical SAM superfamily protein PflX